MRKGKESKVRAWGRDERKGKEKKGKEMVRT